VDLEVEGGAEGDRSSVNSMTMSELDRVQTGATQASQNATAGKGKGRAILVSVRKVVVPTKSLYGGLYSSHDETTTAFNTAPMLI